MLWAAITTAFFGFLKVSDYTSSHKTKFDPSSNLLYHNLSLDNNRARIQIKASTTDRFCQGISICLAANDSLLCPIKALKQYLPYHLSKTGPLFSFSNNKFQTR